MAKRIAMNLLSVDNLATHFHTRNGVIKAVDGLSFGLDRGETLGIVGESGSGKSVAMHSLLGLVPTPPGRIESGTAEFDGIDLLQQSNRDMRRVRGKRIGLIFQDPMTSLNPFMRIGDQVAEPLRVHDGVARRDALAQAVDALRAVGIGDPERRIDDYPHNLSGGMRQRAAIAMALIARPELLIADEPTTALDVTVQAQILEVIRARQAEMGMAVVLISHDLGVVARTCRRIMVMYAGRAVEAAATADVFRRPRHPYTEALLQSMPSRHRKGERLYSMRGMPPAPGEAVEGCRFAPRCEDAIATCSRGRPELLVLDGHASACLRVQEGSL